MSRKIVDLGPEVTLLNTKAAQYHIALQASQRDLYLVFCQDLWGNPRCLTLEALKAFYSRYRGKHVYMVVPIDPIMAAELVDEVMVAEDFKNLVPNPGPGKDPA